MNQRSLLVLTALMFSFAGCKGDSNSNNTPETNNQNDAGFTDGFVGVDDQIGVPTAPPLDPRIDADGDGIADADEGAGWTILVDETGRPQGITPREVDSDPTNADTDEDGLSDGVERLVGSDPRSPDTDGDGLSDHDEVTKWGTSPTSVDTDGDSIAPGTTEAPNVALFDAAELDLVDGEVTLASTSPLLTDTDGDGVGDRDELGLPTRNAVVAEIPQFDFNPVAETKLGLFLDVTITEGEVRTEEISGELELSSTDATSHRSETGISASAWVRQMIDTALVIDIGLDLCTFGAKAGLFMELESEIGGSAGGYTSYGFSESSTNATRETIETFKELGQTREQTIDGGRLSILVEIENSGPIAFKMANVSMATYWVERLTGDIRPLATLTPVGGGDLVLGVGETSEVIMEARGISADRIVSVMENPGSLLLSSATANILSAGDEDYAFIDALVNERTATINIDFTDRTEKYRIATNVPHESGIPSGRTLGELLTMVDVPWEEQALAEDDPQFGQYAYYLVGDERTEFHSGFPPTLGDPGEYPEGKSPGQRVVKRGWFAWRKKANGEVEFLMHPFETKIFAGDVISLVVTNDNDRDGVPAIEEAFRGTSDESIDSDGDGLSDWFEIFVGWQVSIASQPPYQVFSDPTLADADGDTLSDLIELTNLGTDPNQADTDQDLEADDVELTDENRSPIVYEDFDPPVPACATHSSRPADLRTDHDRVGVTDASQNLVSVEIEFTDGSVHSESFSPRRSYDRVFYGQSVVRVTAKDNRGNETEITCGVQP